MSKPTSKNKNRLLIKYSGLAFQFAVSIGFALFVGFKLDGWLNFSTPVFVWLLPLLFIIVLLYQIIKDTSKKKSD